MNNTRHTPGPWETLPAEKDEEYLRIRGTRLGGRYKIASVLAPKYRGASRALTLRENAESRANADLIAAAPELLEALEMMMEGGLEGPTTDAIEKAQAAIAKAKGGRK